MDRHHDINEPGTGPSSTTNSMSDTIAISTGSDTESIVKNSQATVLSSGNDNLHQSKDEGVPKAEAEKPCIMYRVEYRYDDEEIAYEKEGHDEANLFIARPTPVDALPPITITTVFYSRISSVERSRKSKKKKSSTKKGEKDNETTDNQKGTSVEKEEAANVEDFADSHVRSKYMTIHSKKLLNALKDVISYYPGVSGTSLLLLDKPKLYEPYRILCHYEKDLRRYKNNQPPWHDEQYREECNQHLDLLLDFLDHHYGKALQDEEARWARSIPVCTFEYLWLLLKPGEACYYIDEDEINPYITQEVGSILENKYPIGAWNIDFNGHQMGRCMKIFWMPAFDGEKEIRSLKYYPTRFYNNEDQESMEKYGEKGLERSLVARGRRFWTLAKSGVSHQEYKGNSTLQGRVVVDPLAYFGRYDFERSDRGTKEGKPMLVEDGLNDEADKMNTVEDCGGCQCTSCIAQPSKSRRGKFDGFHGLYPAKYEPPKDELFFFLCNRRVFAFILKSRTWDSIYVNNLVDIKQEAHAFQHLVLPDDVKHTLKAISCSYVKAQEVSREYSPDIVKGKGEGKIFLLHGPPGTGKTLSAEVVAELTKRPLLSLTCGDLGTTAEEVELRLGRFMSLGELWGAVVLLDEADIYLEARSINEVKRNSLVSVFLRALEYYKGLLFLTTNRVSTFDEAFRSRIHVAIEYKRLTNDYRKQIWQNNFDKIISSRVNVKEMARQYAYEDIEVLDLEWNGREIRNALQTAVSLAEFEAEEKGQDTITIQSKHLKRIVALSASFQRYIRSMHGGKKDSYIARQKHLRNDDYKDTHPINSGVNSVRRSKNLQPMVGEENSRARPKGRTVHDAEELELEEQELRTRDGKLKKHRRSIAGSSEDVYRSRSQQPSHQSRQIAAIEEDSETEMSKLEHGSRQTHRFQDEDLSEEADAPRKSTMKPLRNRDVEDEYLSNQTRLSQKATKRMPVYMQGEENVHIPQLTRPTKRATMTLEDDDRYARRESPSAAKAKGNIAKRAMREVSESDDEV